MLLQKTKILKIPIFIIFKFNNIRIYRNYKKILIKVFHTQLFLGKRPFSFFFFFFDKGFSFREIFFQNTFFFFGTSPPPFLKFNKIQHHIQQKFNKIQQNSTFLSTKFNNHHHKNSSKFNKIQQN